MDQSKFLDKDGLVFILYKMTITTYMVEVVCPTRKRYWPFELYLWLQDPSAMFVFVQLIICLNNIIDFP